jgi:diguanylate cyclase (GGDEF)-like protein
LGLFIFAYLEIFLKLISIEDLFISGVVILLITIVITIFILGWVDKKQGYSISDGKIDHTSSIQTEQTRFVSLLNGIVAASLESSDMPGMLNNLVGHLVDLFSADMCMITICDDENDRVSPLAANGSGSKDLLAGFYDQETKNLTMHVLEIGHAIVLDETEFSPFLGPKNGIKFILAVPLISEGKNQGGLFLGFHSENQFSEQDLKWGELSARHVSLAVSRVILMEETASRVRELSGLHRISQVLNFPEISQETYGQLSEILATLMGADICMIGLYDAETTEIVFQASAYGLESGQTRELRFSSTGGDLEGVFADKTVYFSNSPEEIDPFFREHIQSLGVNSFMAVKLKGTNTSMLGFIFLMNKPQGYSKEDVQFVTVLSDQVSFVIQNMLLFSSERRRNEELSVLNDISIAAANAQNEDDLIEFVTQLIGEKLFSDNFGVMMLDKSGEMLVLHTTYRLGAYEIPAKVPLDQGISGFVARTGKPRREIDVRTVADYLEVDSQTLSELCIPIKIGEDVIGVFNAESSRLNAFSKRDEDLLKIMTSQLATAIERLRVDEEQNKQTSALARSNALIKALAQVSSKASKLFVPDGVMQTLGVELGELGLYCAIALPRSEDHGLHIVYTSIPERIIKLIERSAKMKLSDYSFPIEHIWQQPSVPVEPILLQDPASVLSGFLVEVPKETIQRILAPTGVTSSIPICQLPLFLEGSIQGFIWLWGEDLQESDLPAMLIFANQVAITLQNAHLMEEVQTMAVLDELTGIYNRRHFFELAEREFNQARRYELPLSAMIIDIDHFKKVNDNFGHIIGDQVLSNTANILKNNLRDQDTLGRYGGEEFSVIMPVTDQEEAHQIALRLRDKVSESIVKTDAGSVSVNISLGIAQLNNEMPTLLSLIHQADKAMYIAKSTGGNNVGRI